MRFYGRIFFSTEDSPQAIWYQVKKINFEEQLNNNNKPVWFGKKKRFKDH